MTTPASSVTLRWPVIVAACVLLIAAGALGAYVLTVKPRSTPSSQSTSAPAGSSPAPVAAAAAGSLLPDVAIRLDPHVVANAKFEAAAVSREALAGDLQVPAIVEPNRYAQTVVSSIAPGRVMRIAVQEGDAVKRGDAIAEVYSPELAAAQSAYLSMSADFDAAHQEMLRTERLAAIGSASRQELERIRAEHARHASGVEGARTQLKLLGMSDGAISALVTSTAMSPMLTVSAPRGGVITKRQVNEGANVAAGAELVTIADLGTVWIVANVYERDLARVHVGSAAIVTIPALPGVSLPGRVSYIDPQLSAAARTAQLRIEVPNRGGDLRLAMYALVTFAMPAAGDALSVPAAALQSAGEHHFVYLPRPDPNEFIEREVRVGSTTGDRVVILSGLDGNDRVITTGSFLLRSERERRGLRPMVQAAPLQRREILVTKDGFAPATVTVAAGAPIELTFIRKVDETCATEVVVPGTNIKKDLPLNKPVTISLAPSAAGTIAFACGMNMVKGSVVVSAR